MHTECSKSKWFEAFTPLQGPQTLKLLKCTQNVLSQNDLKLLPVPMNWRDRMFWKLLPAPMNWRDAPQALKLLKLAQNVLSQIDLKLLSPPMNWRDTPRFTHTEVGETRTDCSKSNWLFFSQEKSYALEKQSTRTLQGPQASWSNVHRTFQVKMICFVVFCLFFFFFLNCKIAMLWKN
jgi:hypothetical protein